MANNNYISIPNPQDESVVVYRSEDESVTLDVQLADETVWLTQKQMAWLFDRTPQNITIHLGNVYKEKELTREATCKDFLQVQRIMTKMKDQGLIRRVGPDKGGHWEVINNN